MGSAGEQNGRCQFFFFIMAGRLYSFKKIYILLLLLQKYQEMQFYLPGTE